MPVTREQATYLAPIIAACRPYGARQWQHSEITAALVRLGHLGLADVILAAVRCASDRHAESPFAITNTTSPHWRERQGAPATAHQSYDAHGVCDVCSLDQASCVARWSDDHEFVSVAQARARPPAAPGIAADLKQHIACEEPPMRGGVTT